jgi:Domain of unknown function (DUF1707)
MYFIASSFSESSRMRRTGGGEIDSDLPIAICEHLRMSDGADLRASDEERELAASQLREHYAAGRLSEEELNDRLDAVYGARTAGDLRTLLADLPALPPAVADRRMELAERRTELQRELLQQTGGALVPFLICTVIWGATGAHAYFWPAWVALAAVIPLMRNGWRLYGPAPELDRVEEDLARRRDRDGRGERRQLHR